MWNKDLKRVCTYKEPSPEPLWESIAAFVLMTAGAVVIWVFLAIVAG